MVEGGATCVKYLLFAFNFLFFLIGLALIICGGVIQSSFKEYFDIIGSEFNSAAALLIAVGVIIFIIGFFGCCGAVKENYCMVVTFAVLLTVVFFLEIAACITAFQMRDDVEDVVEKGLNLSLPKYESANGTRKAWDALQKNLKCCGVDKGAEDWEGHTPGSDNYPKSCCKEEHKEDPNCGKDLDFAYESACVPKMRSFIETEIMWIGIIGLIMALIQLTGIGFAVFLSRNIKEGYQTV